MGFGIAEDLRMADQRCEIVNADLLAEVIDQVVDVRIEQTRLKCRSCTGSAATCGIR